MKKILLLTVAIVMVLSLCSCDMLAGLINPHTTHVLGDIWKANDTAHWKECDCGEYMGEIGAHTGGKATTEELARCEICGFEYGELATENNSGNGGNGGNTGDNGGNTGDNGGNTGNNGGNTGNNGGNTGDNGGNTGNNGGNTGDNGGNTGNTGAMSATEWTNMFSSLTNFVYDEKVDGELYYTTKFDGDKLVCYDYDYQDDTYFYKKNGVYYYGYYDDGEWVEYEDEEDAYVDYTFAIDYVDAIKNGYSSFTYNATAGTYTASNVTLSGYDFFSITVYVTGKTITSIELSYTLEYDGDTYTCNDKLYGIGTVTVTIPTTSGGNNGDNTGDNGGNNNQGGNTNTDPLNSQVVDFTDSLDTNGPMTEYCLPSTGDIKVLVIPINLTSSKNNSQLMADLEIAFNGTQAQTGWYSVKEYYSISSYGKLNLTFEILDWYTPKKSASYYDSYYDDETGYYGSTLILDEVLNYYDGTIDFSQYDSNADGCIDGIWLIYNYDVNYDSDDSDYWAYVYQTSSDILVDGVYACYYGYAGTDFMYENDTFYDNTNIKIDAHTYIHETGHMMGLDDYYDYDESVGATGGLYYADMMDANIGDHASINKLLLNWINPTVITGKGTLTIDLASFASSGQVLLITPNSISSIYNEYILIEFYTSTLLNENDQIYYDETTNTVYGIRVLHVDANVFTNSNGEVDYNGGTYMTGFKYDNSDESKLFVDTLYCEDLGDGYATSDMLFTMSSDSFDEVYPTYKLHDGTVIDLDIVINSMTIESANITITIN